MNAADRMPSSPSILLVDDERSVCELTGTILELNGFKVSRAMSGGEALQLFEQAPERFGLLVADVMMPIMSGPTLVQRLRSHHPTLPVLFVSGLVSQHNFEGTLGGWFLQKPYSSSLLVRKVREILNAPSPVMRLPSR
ncbi:MAG: response regulator [Nitrospiraceae bacterium]|nr:response regulator [Nitrospiraceae bacterium]